MPATNDASVLNNLRNGSFIGVFTCPIAMCLCSDNLNGTIDCFRGNSSAQIALFAYNQAGSAVVSVINVFCLCFYVDNRSLASYFNQSLRVELTITRPRYSTQTAPIHRWVHQTTWKFSILHVSIVQMQQIQVYVRTRHRRVSVHIVILASICNPLLS